MGSARHIAEIAAAGLIVIGIAVVGVIFVGGSYFYGDYHQGIKAFNKVTDLVVN